MMSHFLEFYFAMHFFTPELRSLQELKKGLTDGLKGGFWGMVSLRIGFIGNTRQGNLISCDYYLKLRVLAPSRFLYHRTYFADIRLLLMNL